MSKLGGYCPAFAWAEFPHGTGGSHIPDSGWSLMRFMRDGGITSWEYILWASDQSRTTQHEDIRRLRQEVGADELILRLYHSKGSALDTPEYRADLFSPRIEHALKFFSRVVLVLAIEPLNEKLGMAGAAIVDHCGNLSNKLRGRFGTRVEICNVPCNAYSGEEGLRLQAELRKDQSWYDTEVAHIYPRTEAEIHGGEWSLPWHLAQAKKPLRVLEFGIHPTVKDVWQIPTAERERLLALLFRTIRGSGIQSQWFIMDGDQEHAEQFYKHSQVADYLALAAASAPQPPAPLPPVSDGSIDVPALTDIMHAWWRLYLKGLSERDYFQSEMSTLLTRHHAILSEIATEQHALIVKCKKIVGIP